MATSGDRTESFSVGQVIDAALRYAGVEPQEASWEAEEARKHLLLVMLDWASRKILPWFLKRVSVTVTNSANSYTLDDEVIDVLSVRYTDGNTPVTMHYIEQGRWDQLDLTVLGPPQLWTWHGQIGPQLMAWPRPASGITYTADAWVAFRADGPTSGEETLPVDMTAMDALQKRVGAELFGMMPIEHRAKFQQQGMALVAAAQDAYKRLILAKGQPSNRWRWRRM